MTISSSVRTAGPYVGTGLTTVFSFAFKVFQAADLLVARTDTGLAQSTLVLSVDYTVTLNSDQNVAPGGIVTLLAALPLNYSLTITSNIATLQPLSLPNQGGFFPRNIEDELDRLTILLQQLNFNNSQALRVPEIGGVISVSALAARANNLLGFDSLGNPVAVAPVSGTAAALATDLANSTVAAKGAGQVGFGYALAYAAGTIGKWLQDLALAAGSTFLGWIQSGSGAVLRTVSDKLRDQVSVFDFMTSAQIADVRAGTLVLDVTAAIQFAINSITAGTVYFPAGNYKVTAAITFKSNVNLIGAGQDATKISYSNATCFTFMPASLTTGNIRIADLTLAGTAAATSAIQSQYTTLVHVERVTFSGFTNTAANIVSLVQNCFEWTIGKCAFFFNCTGVALQGAAANQCNNCQVRDSTFVASGSSAFGVTISAGTDQTLIQGCNFEGSSVGNVGVFCSGTVSTSIVANYFELWAGACVAANSGVASNLTIAYNSMNAVAAASAFCILNSAGPNDRVLITGNRLAQLGTGGYSAIGFLMGSTTNYSILNNKSGGAGTGVVSIAGVTQTNTEFITSSNSVSVNGTLLDPSGRITNLLQVANAAGNKYTQSSGAPGTPGGNPLAGDLYFRTDTPGTALQRIYVCTVGGGTPTWVGIA